MRYCKIGKGASLNDSRITNELIPAGDGIGEVSPSPMPAPPPVCLLAGTAVFLNFVHRFLDMSAAYFIDRASAMYTCSDSL